MFGFGEGPKLFPWDIDVELMINGQMLIFLDKLGVYRDLARSLYGFGEGEYYGPLLTFGSCHRRESSYPKLPWGSKQPEVTVPTPYRWVADEKVPR
uniref:Glycosyltransferase n=1 Tax=Steinernema glaseri TaxID=37863 RepID=A0A1I7ZMJ7_9BILA